MRCCVTVKRYFERLHREYGRARSTTLRILVGPVGFGGANGVFTPSLSFYRRAPPARRGSRQVLPPVRIM